MLDLTGNKGCRNSRRLGATMEAFIWVGHDAKATTEMKKPAQPVWALRIVGVESLEPNLPGGKETPTTPSERCFGVVQAPPAPDFGQTLPPVTLGPAVRGEVVLRGSSLPADGGTLEELLAKHQSSDPQSASNLTTTTYLPCNNRPRRFAQESADRRPAMADRYSFSLTTFSPRYVAPAQPPTP